MVEIQYVYLEQEAGVTADNILAGAGWRKAWGVSPMWPEKPRPPFEAALERDRGHDVGLRHLRSGTSHRMLLQLNRAVLPGWMVPVLEEHVIVSRPRQLGKTITVRQLRERGLSRLVTVL